METNLKYHFLCAGVRAGITLGKLLPQLICVDGGFSSVIQFTIVLLEPRLVCPQQESS